MTTTTAKTIITIKDFFILRYFDGKSKLFLKNKKQKTV